MAKTLNVLGHGLASLGVALLMLTCFLVPQHRVLGDDGGPGTVIAGCSGTACSNGCEGVGCSVNAAGRACLLRLRLGL